MENQTSLIVNYLRSVNLDTYDLRLQRSLLCAQLIAYRVPLHSKITVDEAYTKYGASFKSMLNEINEACTLDVGTTLRLVNNLIATRVRLISDPLQFDVLKTVLESETAVQEVGDAAAELMSQLASDSGKMALTVNTISQLEDIEESTDTTALTAPTASNEGIISTAWAAIKRIIAKIISFIRNIFARFKKIQMTLKLAEAKSNDYDAVIVLANAMTHKLQGLLSAAELKEVDDKAIDSAKSAALARTTFNGFTVSAANMQANVAMTDVVRKWNGYADQSIQLLKRLASTKEPTTVKIVQVPWIMDAINTLESMMVPVKDPDSEVDLEELRKQEFRGYGNFDTMMTQVNLFGDKIEEIQKTLGIFNDAFLREFSDDEFVLMKTHLANVQGQLESFETAIKLVGEYIIANANLRKTVAAYSLLYMKGTYDFAAKAGYLDQANNRNLKAEYNTTTTKIKSKLS